MKKLLLLFILLLFVSFNINAQSVQNYYKGTWEYQSGNQKFMVKFWEEDGKTLGRYKMITVDANGQQTGVIYTSKDKWGNSNYPPDNEIYAGSTGGLVLSGIIHDTTVNDPLSDFISGDLRMELESFNASTATWKVTRSPGIKIDGEPDFNIPTDIILTKVSNLPYPD